MITSNAQSRSADKTALRRAMEKRRAAAQAKNPGAALALRDNFLKSLRLPPGCIIAAYNARGSEIDPAPLADALRAKRHPIALPVIMGRGEPLAFRLHNPGDPLVTNAFGIGEPGPASPFIEPDVVLVPLLAFDARGHRLGTGAGYYDRTLPDLRRQKPVLAVGLAFADQQGPEIPVESHDIRLDRIVTELEVFILSAP